MRIKKLNKKVLRFSGQVDDLIQGYTSQTTNAHHNAFLDIQGKIVVTHDQIRSGADALLIVIEKQYEERLRTHLGKYLPLFDISIEAPALEVYFDLDGDHAFADGDHVIPQSQGCLIITPNSLQTNVGEDEFNLFRLNHHLPIQGLDYDDTLLLNIAQDERIDYDKGCYLGQEIIARVHYRAKPPLQLKALDLKTLSPKASAIATSITHNPETNQAKGFVFLRDQASKGRVL
ncbi:MAG: folate-binding protein YgfZ [Candidatus Omnitrophota bacterium]